TAWSTAYESKSVSTAPVPGGDERRGLGAPFGAPPSQRNARATAASELNRLRCSHDRLQRSFLICVTWNLLGFPGAPSGCWAQKGHTKDEAGHSNGEEGGRLRLERQGVHLVPHARPHRRYQHVREPECGDAWAPDDQTGVRSTRSRKA